MLQPLLNGAKKLAEKGKRAARTALIGAAMTAAGLGLIPEKARAAEQMTGFVNGVAAVQGLQGADWHTDVWIHNGRNDYPVTVRLFYAPKGTPVNEQNFVQVVIQPGTTTTLKDVVGSTFATQGSGGLFFQILPQEFAEGIIVESNTYNRLGNGKEFGQQVPGRQWIDPRLERGEPGKIVGDAGIDQFAPGPIDNHKYRANLAFITNHQCNKARVIIMNNTSNILVDQLVEVTPNTWYQWTDIVKRFGLQDQLNGLYVQFIPMNGQAFSSASMIDNKTNDGSNFDAQTRMTIESDAFLLAAAYLEGANNSRWRSDVLTINGNPASRTVATFFSLPRGQDNSGNPDWEGRAYFPGETIIFPNILGNLFEYPSGTSATLIASQLEQEPERDLLAFMRTYSEEQNDQGKTVTYGQAVRPVNWKDSIRNDLEGRIIGIAHNSNFRTNLILQNTTSRDRIRTDTPQDAIVEIYNDQGTLLGSKTYNLLPGEYRQVNKVAEDILGPQATIENATIVVKAPGIPERYRGGVIAAASVINGNTTPGTNDPRLIIAQPIDRTVKVDPVEAFVDWYLGDSATRTCLSNDEYRAMINGTPLTRSYNQDFSRAVYYNSNPPLPFPIDIMIRGNLDDTDCNLTNGEMWRAYDPIQLSPAASGWSNGKNQTAEPYTSL